MFFTVAPTNIRVYPDPDDFDGGIVRLQVDEVINCTADGRPLPTYNWYSSDGGDIRPGPVLTVSSDMISPDTHTYRCEANNLINGVRRYANRNVTFLGKLGNILIYYQYIPFKL